MDLASVFRESLRSSGGLEAAGGDEGPAFETSLRGFCERGRAAFPQLHVEAEAFARHLAEVMARSKAGSPPLASRAIEDLYLACACLARVPGAAEAFDERCAASIEAAVARLARSPSAKGEVLQAARDVLLVGRADAPPKIALYLGTGPLARWAAVTGQRLALLEIRADRVEARARGALAKEPALPADPELAFLKQQYRGEFETALAALVAALDSGERALLRLNLIEGMSAEKIGKMYGMSRATAQRRIEDVRGKIADGVLRTMRERHALSASGIGSLAGALASQIDVSLSRMLRAR